MQVFSLNLYFVINALTVRASNKKHTFFNEIKTKFIVLYKNKNTFNKSRDKTFFNLFLFLRILLGKGY